MPIKKILVIGAGPIIIGQGCEFDYSGTQACLALKKCGYHIILINSNPATIMTEADIADITYIEPICTSIIEKIIEKEKPDALLATMGGQTALNCAMALFSKGVLDQYGVQLIGTNAQVLEIAENRTLFKQAMAEIHLSVPQSFTITNIDNAKKILDHLSFPIMIRSSFTLGGLGSGIVYHENDFYALCHHALQVSPIKEILIEQSVIGWKEFEMEVIRDNNDNCIIVCAIENIDPMGVHTGDSMSVSPIQTLTDLEYQAMRRAAFEVVRKIGVIGGANVQFAINPKTGDMLVIEMNPRVSRSSALASKATGYPIAKVSAKLAVGYTLDNITNELTGVSAAFEPVMDYVVVKLPRFNFEKFPGSNITLGTQMKAVGEVMAIGRTFQESLQKAILGLEENLYGFEEQETFSTDKLLSSISRASPHRFLQLAELFRRNISVDIINKLTHIDPWFLYQIQEIIETEGQIKCLSLQALSRDFLYHLKRKGFSDKRLAKLLNTSEDQVRQLRYAYHIKSVYKRVDTCAAEFPTNSFYLYSTYEEECEVPLSNNKKILIVGSGPNRIGQGIEFDYSCVHAAWAVKALGYEALMINCNPSTVSTDYDISSRLYFEPIILEHILSVLEKEKPVGIILQCGGQAPLKLAEELNRLGFSIIGTTYDSIDIVENRNKFRLLLTSLGIPQPKNGTAHHIDDMIKLSHEIGYPVVLRPSYVLGGANMKVIHHEEELKNYLHSGSVDCSHPESILLEKFLNQAIEYDVDAISDGEQVFIAGIMEQSEHAGIHSGDSTCSLAKNNIPQEIELKITSYLALLNDSLNIKGFFNVQLALHHHELYVIEVNPRASRTIPFVAKSRNLPLVKLAVSCMLGKKLSDNSHYLNQEKQLTYAVKSPVFSCKKIINAKHALGIEMRSTGEVMGIANSIDEAIFKAYLAKVRSTFEEKKAYLQIDDEFSSNVRKLAHQLINVGYTLYANIFEKDMIEIKKDQIASFFEKENISFVLHINKDDSIDNLIKKLCFTHNALFFNNEKQFSVFVNYLTGNHQIHLHPLQ